MSYTFKHIKHWKPDKRTPVHVHEWEVHHNGNKIGNFITEHDKKDSPGKPIEWTSGKDEDMISHDKEVTEKIKGIKKSERLYSPQEMVTAIAKSLSSKLKEYNKTKAKAVVKDLEDEDNMPEIDTSPSPEKNILQKAKVDAGKDVIDKVNIRRKRAQEMGTADRKRFQTTKERLKEKRDLENIKKPLEKSNYGPKGAKLYNQADNERRKGGAKGNVEIESGYSSVKMKTGANSSGGQGKTKLNREMAALKAKNKKQPVTSLKDMSPEKQAEMLKLYSPKIKKNEKLKIFLEKRRSRYK